MSRAIIECGCGWVAQSSDRISADIAVRHSYEVHLERGCPLLRSDEGTPGDS